VEGFEKEKKKNAFGRVRDIGKDEGGAKWEFAEVCRTTVAQQGTKKSAGKRGRERRLKTIFEKSGFGGLRANEQENAERGRGGNHPSQPTPRSDPIRKKKNKETLQRSGGCT